MLKMIEVQFEENFKIIIEPQNEQRIITLLYNQDTCVEPSSSIKILNYLYAFHIRSYDGNRYKTYSTQLHF